MYAKDTGGMMIYVIGYISISIICLIWWKLWLQEYYIEVYSKGEPRDKAIQRFHKKIITGSVIWPLWFINFAILYILWKLEP